MSKSIDHPSTLIQYEWNREPRWMIVLCLLATSLVAGLWVFDNRQPPTPGVSATEVRVGTSLPLEGPLSPIGYDYLSGVMTAIEVANKAGGVHGRKIVLISRDDGYDPLKCVLNTRDLIIKDSVFALTSYFGTPTSVKAQPTWTGAQVPIIGVHSGAQSLREPFNRYNFHTHASYRAEADAIVNALLQVKNIRKIAIFFQYDSFGRSLRKETIDALSRYGITPVAEGSYERNSMNIESAVQNILAAQPEAVVVLGTALSSAKFIKEVRARSKQAVIFTSFGTAGSEAFLASAGRDAEGCLMSQTLPLFDMSDHIQLVKDFERDLKNIYPDKTKSVASLEGYVNARVLVEGLRRAGRQLTRERFIVALESFRGDVFGPGFDITYGPTDHEGGAPVYMTQVKEGRLEYIDVKN